MTYCQAWIAFTRPQDDRRRKMFANFDDEARAYLDRVKNAKTEFIRRNIRPRPHEGP